MTKSFLSISMLLVTVFSFAQDDERRLLMGQVIYKNVNVVNEYVINSTTEKATITNDDGRFYFEAVNTYQTLIISFIGFKTQEIELKSKVNYDLKVTLEADIEQLNEVIFISGKQSKKNNPAVEILKKICFKTVLEYNFFLKKINATI